MRGAAVLAAVAVLAGCATSGEPAPNVLEPVLDLDGTYIVEYDGTGVANGAPSQSLVDGKSGWVFRSSCDEHTCVAAGGEITDPNDPAAPLRNPRAADYAGDRWTMVNFTEGSAACTGPRGERFTGDVWAAWEIAIAPDMTPAPTVTTIGTGDCPSVSVVTPTMTRAGDALPEFPAPDPAAQPARAETAAAAFRGGYTVTRTRRDPAGEPQVTERDVATYCLRTGDRCVTTAAIPGAPGATNAYLAVYEVTDGTFTRRSVPLPAVCDDGSIGVATEVETLTLPADVAAGALPELRGEVVTTFTAGCPGTTTDDIAYRPRPA